MILRNYINKYRQEADLSQQALGEMIGVTRSVVNNWEKDLTDPTPTQQQDIAMALGVSMRDVFPRFHLNVGVVNEKRTLESYDTLRLNSRIKEGDKMLVKLINVADFGQTFVPGRVVQCTPYWFRVKLDKTGASVCFTYQEYMTDTSIRRVK